MDGIIIKGVGGLYFVETDDGIVECSARGKFRKKGEPSPLVGDRVEIIVEADGTGAISKIHKRTSTLIRPAVANINQLIVTFAAKDPEPDLYLVDKLIVAAESQKIDICVLITKSDLTDANAYADIYRLAGYPVIISCAQNKTGVDELKRQVKGKISAFAGASGVGKSSIINTLSEEFFMQTGNLSQKISRGRHTTRHVELLPLQGGGYVLDTPGFSSVEIPYTEPQNLWMYFPEIRKENGQCRFYDCTHRKEPDCAVKLAVEEGRMDKGRYEHYLKLLKMQQEINKWDRK